MARFASFILCVTLAGLFYVYEEVEAVKIGYTIHHQEEAKVQALDRARALKYNIDRLKAPHNLERKLLAQRILLESPKEWQTLVMPSTQGLAKAKLAGSRIQPPPFFSRLFVGTAQAEAKESSNR